MLTKQQALTFATEWIAAFNSHNLEQIFALYDNDFEMTSPYIVSRMGVEAGKLKGKANVRPYWAKSLQAEPPLEFRLIDVFVGVDSVVVYYESIGRNYVCETFKFNEYGKVIAGFSQHRAQL